MLGTFVLVTSALLLNICSPAVFAMSGMHFTNDDNWPTSGVSDVRIWDMYVTWNTIHLDVDKYDFSGLDAVVSRIESTGARMIYVIGATPQWLAKYPDQPYYAEWLGPGSNSMPWSIDEFNKFIWNVATRYKGRIMAYEVWNEPQLAEFLYPYNSVELDDLAQMTQRAYSTIKSCDPSALVLGASVLPRESSGGMSKASKYLDSMSSHGWNIDAFTTHIYTENGVGADGWNSMLLDAQSSIAAYGPPTSALYVTETTYNLLGDVIPESEAGTLVNSTYAYAAAAGVENIYWYRWDDPSLGGLQINAQSEAWYAIEAHA